MKRLRFLIALLIAVSIAYLAVQTWPESARTARPIQLATGAWEPFIGPDLESYGPVARVVTETLRLMGWEPDLSFSSWDVVLDKMGRGEVLGGFPFIPTSERALAYQVSAPICEFEYVLFYNKAEVPGPDRPGTVLESFTADDLQSYTFGKVDGYEVWAELATATSQLTFEPFPSSDKAFAALAKGEIHFLPESLVHGLAVLRDIPDAERVGHLGAESGELFGATETLHLLVRGLPAGFMTVFNATLGGVKTTALYKIALEEIRAVDTEPADLPVVLLRPNSGDDYVRVVEPDSGSSFIVPAGTRAAVREWPAAFKPGHGESATPLLCEVKLLNGPERGRLVRVDARAVTLIE